MPKFRVNGAYSWTEEHEEWVDIEVEADTEEEAIAIVGADQFGLVEMSDDVIGGYSRFDGEVTPAEDVFDDPWDDYYGNEASYTADDDEECDDYYGGCDDDD